LQEREDVVLNWKDTCPYLKRCVFHIDWQSLWSLPSSSLRESVALQNSWVLIPPGTSVSQMETSFQRGALFLTFSLFLYIDRLLSLSAVASLLARKAVSRWVRECVFSSKGTWKHVHEDRNGYSCSRREGSKTSHQTILDTTLTVQVLTDVWFPNNNPFPLLSQSQSSFPWVILSPASDLTIGSSRTRQENLFQGIDKSKGITDRLEWTLLGHTLYLRELTEKSCENELTSLFPASLFCTTWMDTESHSHSLGK
jgi:hypothetical protein